MILTQKALLRYTLTVLTILALGTVIMQITQPVQHNTYLLADDSSGKPTGG
jgi:hypothetical protein